MPEPIISVERLSKCYRLQHQSGGPGYQRFSESLVHWAKAPLRWLSKPQRRSSLSHLPSPVSETEEFWALKEVSFDIQPGEKVGIIGRNGAGKSTLLKILSRITQPTTGRAILRGRVASLLEVGTGFHPELTGRENIYLNGAILGMTKAEIRARFDEIVAFAEVEKFLDTPVKHYSSGMHVRLAFAVAAHLEPEILIVDEVLAVADAEFQKKCLGKMQETSNQEGRTVLFVSHNLGAIRQLTTRCVVLNGGQVMDDGPVETAVSTYLTAIRSNSSRHDVARLARPVACTGEARFTALRFEDEAGILSAVNDLKIAAEIESLTVFADIRVSLMISTQDGTPVGSAFSANPVPLQAGRQTLAVRVPACGFAPGHFHCTLAISRGSGQVIDAVAEVLPFEIVPGSQAPYEPQTWHRHWGALKLPSLEVNLSA